MTYTADELDALLKLAEEGPYKSTPEARSAFIAASREAIPRLVAELKEATAHAAEFENGETYYRLKAQLTERDAEITQLRTANENNLAGWADDRAGLERRALGLEAHLAAQDARIAELEEGLRRLVDAPGYNEATENYNASRHARALLPKDTP